MRKGNVRARPPDAPQAHQGNRKGSTGKLLREYRRIRYSIQGNFPASMSKREGQRPRCLIRHHTGNEDVAPPVSLPLTLYFPLTSTGFDCAAAFVSLPALSAVWWDCVITAMPGMPKA